MKKEVSYDKVLLRLAGLCAASEQCSSDIRIKVLKAGLSAEDAERVVEYLISHRYVDDGRFAKAFAADKVRFSGWGRIKIRMALRAKGLSDVIVSSALQSIDADDYKEALRKALAAKAESLDLHDVKGRQSLYRHLASRGFESSMIVEEIRAYIKVGKN